MESKPDSKSFRKLTGREKNLLSVLAVLAAGAGLFFLLIQPLILEMDSYKAELDTAGLRRMELLTQTTGIGDMTGITDELRAELELARSAFTPYISPESAESEFTGKMLELGLVPQSFRISEYIPEEDQEEKSYQEASQEAELAERQNTNGEESNGDESELMLFTIDITAQGTIADLMGLADYINSTPSYSLTRMDVTGDGQNDQPARSEITVLAVFIRPQL